MLARALHGCDTFVFMFLFVFLRAEITTCVPTRVPRLLLSSRRCYIQNTDIPG